MAVTASIAPPPADGFEFTVPVLVVGAGGCGLTAALAARDADADVLVLERDPKVWGTTSMSTGLIPAAGTPEQAARGIADSPEQFAQDILGKTKGQTDAGIVQTLATESAQTVAWLKSQHNIPIDLIDGFTYPGHSAMRMYGTPNRTGGELMAALEGACAEAGADILTDAQVTTLYVDSASRICGAAYARPDGSSDAVGCDALVLACCGFAGNEAMVQDLIPELEGATFHGHPGNQGEAMMWGKALGAALEDMHSYQGHGGLAVGHAIPILWPLIMEGGYQVNRLGQRFSDESKGYSEQAVKVVAQPEHAAWSILDQRLYDLMIKFDDFQQAVSAGAVMRGETLADLAITANLPVDTLEATNAAVDAAKLNKTADAFGRNFNGKPALSGPFYAVKVTGALFHTQGGLKVDGTGRVLRADGSAFPNLFAGGGSARGISGPGADGYIAGNGLLTATTFGRLAGSAAALQVSRAA
ncbi:MAG: FAD-dependent oxidoreductase [Pseudomonadota bacterium]